MTPIEKLILTVRQTIDELHVYRDSCHMSVLQIAISKAVEKLDMSIFLYECDQAYEGDKLKHSLILALNEIEGWRPGIVLDSGDCEIVKKLHEDVGTLLTYYRELKSHIKEQAENSKKLLEEI